MSSVVTGLLIILGSVVIGAIAITVILTLMRANYLIIRDCLNQDAYVVTYRCTEWKDKKSGTLYWKSVFWQRKLLVPEPPPDAIDIGRKGRKFVEAYRVSEDEYVWAKDKGIKIEEEIDKETGIKHMRIVDVEKSGKTFTIDTFKPLTAIQREVTFMQYRKAAEQRQKRWTPEKVMATVGIGGLVFILALIVIFWGDLVAPVKDAQEFSAQQAQHQAELTERISQILARLQGQEVGSLPQNPPVQETNVIVQPGETPPT